jgi:hypothetical protein
MLDMAQVRQVFKFNLNIMKILLTTSIVLVIIYSFFNRKKPIDCDYLQQISLTPELSIERKVFVSKIAPTKNPLIVNDTIQIAFKEIWIEKVYSMDCWGEIVHRFGQHGERYQMIAITDSITLKKTKFSIEWGIGSNSLNYWRKCGVNAITSYVDSLPKDTIFYPVQIGLVLNPKLKQNIVDTIGFYPIEF